MAKKFVFAFDALKRYRNNRLLVGRKDMFVVEAKARSLLESKNAAIAARGEILDGGRDGNPADIVAMSGMIETQTLKIRRLDEEILATEKELERHREWVTHLGRELKIVEKLEEKRREMFRAEESMREKREVDSWVAERWTRTMVNEAEPSERRKTGTKGAGEAPRE